MAQKTIAFSNKGGFWKTRYSFLSSCFSSLDKMFFSSPSRSNSGEVFWGHNKNNVGRNSFYNVQIPSSLAVTFNQKPSTNKVFKSFSLEGTTNISGLNTVMVNNSSDPTQLKRSSVSLLTEKGGIMYGDIGAIEKITGSNIKAIGVINSITNVTEDEPNYIPNLEGSSLHEISISAFTSNNPIPASGDAKLFLSISNNGNTISEVFQRTGDGYTPALANTEVTETLDDGTVQVVNGALGLFELNPGFVNDVDFDDYLTLGSLYFDNNNSFKKGNRIYVEFNENSNLYAPTLHPDQELDFDANTYVLYAMTPASTSGDSPKGQYADAIVTLGSDNFELYSLNIEYEPTQYDHDRLPKKAATTKSTKTSGRKR